MLTLIVLTTLTWLLAADPPPSPMAIESFYVADINRDGIISKKELRMVLGSEIIESLTQNVNINQTTLIATFDYQFMFL